MSGALTYRRRTALPVAEPHSEPRPARIAYLALIYYRETSQVPSFTLQLELHTHINGLGYCYRKDTRCNSALDFPLFLRLFFSIAADVQSWSNR